MISPPSAAKRYIETLTIANTTGMFLIMNDFDRAICDSHYTKFMY